MNNRLHSDSSEFDQLELIGQAAACYTPADPRPGLELRILNTLAASQLQRTRSVSRINIKLWWTVAASTAAAVGLAAGLWIYVRPSVALHQATQNALQAETLPEQASKGGRASQAEPSPQSIHRLKLSKSDLNQPDSNQPKLNQPVIALAGRPLKPTAQELLLEQLAANGFAKTLAQPDTIADVNTVPIDKNPIEIQPLSTKPISIDPIQIAALQPLSSHAE